MVDPGDSVVVYVGRINRRKDVRNILTALSILKQIDRNQGERCSLLVVGGETHEPDPLLTPELGDLQKLAQALGLADKVIFTGKRTKEELRHYYSAGDVVVTTPWYEPFGLTPLEAMACGRPVIGSNVGGIRFTVLHGRTGLLVPPREPRLLARELAGLLADSRKQSALGVAGRHRVERMFTWSAVAARTDALYREVVRNASADVARINLPVGLMHVASAPWNGS
jgi:glycosyltransferase involved in cell wall biosynthesis